MTSLSKPRPVQEFRVGAVKAAIWKREHEGQTFYNVSIDRSYKQNEQWKRTSSFSKDELAIVADLAKRAEAYIDAAEAKLKQSV